MASVTHATQRSSFGTISSGETTSAGNVVASFGGSIDFHRLLAQQMGMIAADETMTELLAGTTGQEFLETGFMPQTMTHVPWTNELLGESLLETTADHRSVESDTLQAIVDGMKEMLGTEGVLQTDDGMIQERIPAEEQRLDQTLSSLEGQLWNLTERLYGDSMGMANPSETARMTLLSLQAQQHMHDVLLSRLTDGSSSLDAMVSSLPQEADTNVHRAMHTTDGTVFSPWLIQSTLRSNPVVDRLNEIDQNSVLSLLEQHGGSAMTRWMSTPATVTARDWLGALQSVAPLSHLTMMAEQTQPIVDSTGALLSDGSPLGSMIDAVRSMDWVGSDQGMPREIVTGWSRFDEWLRTQLATGQNTFTSQTILKLSPEHLGDVEVQLMMQQGVVQATFLTESSMAKEALEGQLAQLKQQLQLQGMTVERITVTDASAYTLNQQQQQGQGQRQHHPMMKQSQEDDDGMSGQEWELSFHRSLDRLRGGSFNTIA